MAIGISRVLLITPPYIARGITPHPQMGLACLGAYLEQHGYVVKIVDAMAMGWQRSKSNGWDHRYIGLYRDEISRIIGDFLPDVVGVHNNFSSQYRMPHMVFGIVKELGADIVTMTGGNHASVCPKSCLGDPNLDYVIIGEGELPVMKLFRYLEGKIPADELDGVAYRRDGTIVIIPPKETVTNLDQLPFPARHLLDMELYWKIGLSHGQRRKRRFSPVITSRGCPFHCSFCTYHCVSGRKFRPRSPDHVIAELKMLVEQLGIQEVTFEDDNLILDTARAITIFERMIEEKLNLAWECPNGIAVAFLTKELITKMKDSGCYRLNLAIESGNQEVLDRIIKKPVRLEKIPDLVDFARKSGLEIQAFFVIGTPGETREQIYDTFRFAKKLGIDNPIISICMPLPGSEAFEICRKNMYFDPGFSCEKLSLEYPCFSTDQLTSAELYEIYTEGQRYFEILRLKKTRGMHALILLARVSSLLPESLTCSLKNGLVTIRKHAEGMPKSMLRVYDALLDEPKTNW